VARPKSNNNEVILTSRSARSDENKNSPRLKNNIDEDETQKTSINIESKNNHNNNNNNNRKYIYES